MRKVVFFIAMITLCVSSWVKAQEPSLYEEHEIVFDPPLRMEGMLEKYKGLRQETTELGEKVCVIELEQYPWPKGQGIELDDAGEPLILLDDELTLLSTSELIESIDPYACTFVEAADLVASILFYDTLHDT